MTAALKNVTSRIKEAGPTAGAGYALGLVNFAVSRGADRDTLLKRASIASEVLTDLDNRVPLRRYVALMEAAAALLNDPAIALHYGQNVRMQEISVVGLICEACETTLDVGVQLNRYGRLVFDANGEPYDMVRLKRRDDGLWLDASGPSFGSAALFTESEFARLVWNIKAMFGATDYLREHPFPQEVHFMHAAPAYREEYDRVFQAPIVFDSDRNAMRFHEGFLTLRQPPISRYVFGVLSKRAEMLLNELSASKTARGQVESLLIPILHKGDIGIDVIAEKLGLSRPTLYRKLKAEGTTFEKLLDELRHKLALHYLDGRKVSINETAYLVGFSDPSAFSRAFRRWTGKSPKKRSA
jgi:AraC-like DNA-binding protein